MKKIKLLPLFITLLILTGSMHLFSQNKASTKVKILNAPILFKVSGKSYQQAVASFDSDTTGRMVFSSGGKVLLSTDFIKGENKFLLTFQAVNKPIKVSISVKINDSPSEKYPLTLVPPKKWEVYFVQHSHTDIGYTNFQPEILAEHLRFIDYALDYCDKTDGFPDDAKFRWTCESAWVTREYFRSRPATQIERFKKRVAEGRIEVTGMYFNMAEISDENIMYDFLQPMKELIGKGMPIKLAMQNDVNGVAWCLPDYFKNTGVKYLSMGINKTRSILPFDKPTCFWWEAPSGEKLLAFRGDHYHLGSFYMVGGDMIAEDLLWHLADVDNRGYPFDRISIQFSGTLTDNSAPSITACEIVRRWNEKYEYPKLRLATGSEFMDYVDKKYGNQLPVYKNAWLDWWTDGFGSTSRETAEARKTQNLAQVGQGLFAMTSMLGGKLDPVLEEKINQLSESTLLFDEHTVGYSQSIDQPFSENTINQWLMKGSYAWEAVKKVAMLNEEAKGYLQGFLKQANFPVIYVINTMGWERSASFELFVDSDLLPLDKQFKIIDISTGKEIPTQIVRVRDRKEGAYRIFEVPSVPAMGFKVLKIETINKPEKELNKPNSELEVLENKYYKIVIDKSSGAISSLLDKELNQEFVDLKNPWKLGQLIRETLPERDVMPPSHSSVRNIKVESGIAGNIWESIRIKADMDGLEKGVENTPKGLEMEVRLFKNVKKIEFYYKVAKEIVITPEALYVAFPFSLPESRIVFETIGGTLSQGQQLPGSASDWNTAQNFVSVRGKNGQIIVVSDEIPLWHFSDLNIGKFEPNPKAGKTWLYSWVMNNYWYTNFRAYQDGEFHWTYQITSSRDTTNTYATQFAWGERNKFATRVLPAGKNELSLPVMETLSIKGSQNAILINSRPTFKNAETVLLHFREVEGKSAELSLESKIAGRPIKKITEVNVIGNEVGNPVQSIHFKPFEVKFIEVQF